MKLVIDKSRLVVLFNVENAEDAINITTIECAGVPTITIDALVTRPFEHLQDHEIQLLVKNTTGEFPLGTREQIEAEADLLAFMLPVTSYDADELASQAQYCLLKGGNARFEYVEGSRKPAPQPNDWLPAKLFA